MEVVDIIATLNGVLDDVCFFQNMLPRNPYVGPFTIPLWLINVTTDGLFVWRCYTVCGGLQSQRRWFTLLWVMPLIVYIVMIFTGSIVVARFAAFNVGGILSDALPPFQYSVTGFLNTLITACIVILILRYRCAAREAFGENHEMPYLSIMTVLIESASLVVVIDVLAAVGYSQGVLGNIATQVWVPMQVSFRIQFD
ncbi:hypothetical protein AGABI1DRAFT_132873 [Agaricus bisporus var. burnettii JB137-S8]|uniref:Uncharacterized protein n=1 Tax=Agaricus bisporus var. burnettii (strain JB137-S8 / ATCC MYA-4627 / FGSC 10392) TaxID=597362 RepID=K5VK88_AGABU|nr:uncharacterized protein AGABI1DRAFT_132873 [Agaricus bisporus var. burnettii JB137-S8]EKM74754.1 hypothetical protein AGABI1DRAFT_132873 [Agaricus bisporus var. burnettii JB137-S8]